MRVHANMTLIDAVDGVQEILMGFLCLFKMRSGGVSMKMGM